jgi:tripartite-type tricarboxylate transporter receptor subunit TctC
MNDIKPFRLDRTRSSAFRHRITSFIVVSLMAASGSAAIAQDYPARPVRLVVPFPPGGANDIVARVLSAPLALALGQPVIVDNKGGAAGTIGTDFVAKSSADGYTILMTAAPFVITQSLYPKLPYDGQKDFVPIGLLTSAPFVVAVSAKHPAQTLADLISLARQQPGSVSFSSPGAGSPAHLAGELIKTKGGVDMLHVPYKGGGPAVSDMLAGQVTFTLATPAELMPHVRSGKARALAVTSASRTPLAPGIPTVGESGIPGYEISVWYGIAVPRATPAAVAARLEREFQAAIKIPEVRERMSGLGLEVTPMPAAEFGQFLKRETQKWGDLVRVSGASAE